MRLQETAGDRRRLQETVGDRRRPQETAGDCRRLQETAGDRKRLREEIKKVRHLSIMLYGHFGNFSGTCCLTCIGISLCLPESRDDTRDRYERIIQ